MPLKKLILALILLLPSQAFATITFSPSVTQNSSGSVSWSVSHTLTNLSFAPLSGTTCPDLNITPPPRSSPGTLVYTVSSPIVPGSHTCTITATESNIFTTATATKSYEWYTYPSLSSYYASSETIANSGSSFTVTLYTSEPVTGSGTDFKKYITLYEEGGAIIAPTSTFSPLKSVNFFNSTTNPKIIYSFNFPLEGKYSFTPANTKTTDGRVLTQNEKHTLTILPPAPASSTGSLYSGSTSTGSQDIAQAIMNDFNSELLTGSTIDTGIISKRTNNTLSGVLLDIRSLLIIFSLCFFTWGFFRVWSSVFRR